MLFMCILPASLGAALLLSAAQSVGAAETPLEKAVATGAHLFATATFGGNGRTCETCHKDGGKGQGQLGDRKLPSLLNAAAIFPRFSPDAGEVITLEGQSLVLHQGRLGRDATRTRQPRPGRDHRILGIHR